MLGETQVEVLGVGVGDGLQRVRDHPLRTEAAVDSVVVDGQAARGDGADIPPERQVVVDRDAEDARAAADVAAAAPGRIGQPSPSDVLY
jgi:hypothetical protein